MKSGIAVVTAVLLLLGGAAPAVVSAQGGAAAPPAPAPAPGVEEAPAEESEDPAYTAAVRQAIAAFAKHDLRVALEAFQRAHAIEPSARTLRGMGMVSYELHEFPEAYGYLTAALAEERKPLSEAHGRHVQDLLARTRSFLGIYRVSVDPTGAELFIDGDPARLRGEGELWLPVGKHTIVVRAEGHRTQRMDVQVLGNENEPLQIVMEPGSDDPAPAAATASSERPTPWVPIGLVAGGGALILGSVITGVMTGSAESDLDDLCGAQRVCEESDVSRAEDIQSRGDTLAVVTDVLLFGGIAVAATGAVLWVMALGEESPAETAAIDAGGFCTADGCAVSVMGRF